MSLNHFSCECIFCSIVVLLVLPIMTWSLYLLYVYVYTQQELVTCGSLGSSFLFCPGHTMHKKWTFLSLLCTMSQSDNYSICKVSYLRTVKWATALFISNKLYYNEKTSSLICHNVSLGTFVILCFLSEKKKDILKTENAA